MKKIITISALLLAAFAPQAMAQELSFPLELLLFLTDWAYILSYLLSVPLSALTLPISSFVFSFKNLPHIISLYSYTFSISQLTFHTSSCNSIHKRIL